MASISLSGKGFLPILISAPMKIQGCWAPMVSGDCAGDMRSELAINLVFYHLLHQLKHVPSVSLSTPLHRESVSKYPSMSFAN